MMRMKVPVCHALTGELLRIELPEGALVEELRHELKASAPFVLALLMPIPVSRHPGIVYLFCDTLQA